MHRKHAIFAVFGGVLVLALTGLASNTWGALDRDEFWISLGPRATYFVDKDKDFDDGKVFGGAQLGCTLDRPLRLKGPPITAAGEIRFKPI